MYQKVQNLLLLLERMKDLYLRVFEILDREKLCLIGFEFDVLLQIIREKDEVHSIIKSLDKDRLRIQDQFALIMEKDSDQVTLQFLSQALKEQLPLEAKRLAQLRQELRNTIDSVASKIGVNKRLTEKSIDNLQMIASHLSSAIRGTHQVEKVASTYTGKAKLKKSQGKSGSIVEKRF